MKMEALWLQHPRDIGREAIPLEHHPLGHRHLRILTSLPPLAAVRLRSTRRRP